MDGLGGHLPRGRPSTSRARRALPPLPRSVEPRCTPAGRRRARCGARPCAGLAGGPPRRVIAFAAGAARASANRAAASRSRRRAPAARAAVAGAARRRNGLDRFRLAGAADGRGVRRPCQDGRLRVRPTARRRRPRREAARRTRSGRRTGDGPVDLGRPDHLRRHSRAHPRAVPVVTWSPHTRRPHTPLSAQTAVRRHTRRIVRADTLRRVRARPRQAHAVNMVWPSRGTVRAPAARGGAGPGGGGRRARHQQGPSDQAHDLHGGRGDACPDGPPARHRPASRRASRRRSARAPRARRTPRGASPARNSWIRGPQAKCSSAGPYSEPGRGVESGSARSLLSMLTTSMRKPSTPAVQPPAHHRRTRRRGRPGSPSSGRAACGRRRAGSTARSSRPTPRPTRRSATPSWSAPHRGCRGRGPAARRATSTSRASGCPGCDRDSTNHGCSSLVWLTTRSMSSRMPRACRARSARRGRRGCRTAGRRRGSR